MITAGARRRKAVARGKGVAAEGKALRAFPGQPDNIRLTVAFAESYVLIAEIPLAIPGRRRGRNDRLNTADANSICCVFSNLPIFRGCRANGERAGIHFPELQ